MPHMFVESADDSILPRLEGGLLLAASLMAKEMAGGGPPQNLRRRILLASVIFLLAFGVRVLSWHDTRLEVGKIQTVVTADYQRVAQLLRAGGVSSFFSSTSPLADPNNLGHPPGYSILWASLRTSETGIQFFQITCDALSAVLIFLIVAELLPMGAGLIAGLLAALSPQFAWNAVLLLPDSLSVLPVLAAVYLIARASRDPRLWSFLAAGAMIGISCWLRANGMLLSVFFALAVPLLVKKGWPRFALAVVAGTLLVVLPLTIRNAIVFHRFIPLSLGAGQTLLEGIADYDQDNTLGIPRTDMGIMKQEAEMYGRPDYYGTLFNPDGVVRERARLERGFAVIRAHPVWFASVMAKRASSMVRLERARLISADPSITHSIDSIDGLQPAWSAMPEQLAARGVLLSSQSQTSTASDTCCWLLLRGDDSRYGDQFATEIGTVKKNVDYVLVVPVAADSGRMRLSVKSSKGKMYATAIVEAAEIKKTSADVQQLKLSFVASESGLLHLVVSNEASNPPNPIVGFTELQLYELGPARFLWTRYPRFLINAIQKMFITALMLPLAFIGLLILIFQKQSRALVMLSIVPIYFFLVQSIVHTEYRYVLAVYYFEFALVGVMIWSIGQVMLRLVRSWKPKSVPSA